MNEDSARAVTLLQAFETAQPPSPNWSDDDRAWATRLALQEGAVDADTFIANRARHAMQRLAPREPAAARWLARRLWQPRWIVASAVVGLIIGLLADGIGSSQRINLLAPPLWGVVVWNVVVYLVLIGHGLARLLKRPASDGALGRLAQRLLRVGNGLPKPSARGNTANAGSASAWQDFARLWLRASAPLSAARASTLLHVAAAALALGLIAGMYLRGLVLDYRAAWESTFLSADTARAALATLLAPASALSGIAVPGAAGFAALRGVHGDAMAGASAAPWIHLLALTLLLFVVLPRGVLALAAALRARLLARRWALPLDDAYFQRLARLQQGDVARVVVLPYAATPTPQATLGLRALLAPTLGDGLALRIDGAAAYGDEDERPGDALDAGTTLAIALFDMSSTPEAENHGRFAQQLTTRAPAGAATVMFVDESAFRQRFGADSVRLAQRRDAWRAFAASFGTLAVCVDLVTPDPDAAGRTLSSALRHPLARAAP